MKTNGFGHPKSACPCGLILKGLTETKSLRFSRHPVFRPQIGFEGSISALPPILGPSENRAPELVADGNSVVLIGPSRAHELPLPRPEALK